VTNSLAGRREVPVGTEAFGKSREHLVALELRAYLSYRRSDLQLGFWRTDRGYEVDFTVGSQVAIDVKSIDIVNERHLTGMRALQEERIFTSYCVVSLDRHERTLEGVTVYPWRTFRDKLWNDEITKPWIS